MFMDQKYDLVITGAIGAGKSTLANNIFEYFKNQYQSIAMIPEYIDGMRNGNMMLSKFIEGQLSPKEFQKYISMAIDILNYETRDNTFRIFERTPIENAEIFVPNSDAYEDTKADAELLHKKYNIPLVPGPYCVKVDANLGEEDVFNEVKKIVESDLKQKKRQRVIFLSVDFETALNRINKRNRKAEKSYTHEYLKTIIERYESLFHLK